MSLPNILSNSIFGSPPTGQNGMRLRADTNLFSDTAGTVPATTSVKRWGDMIDPTTKYASGNPTNTAEIDDVTYTNARSLYLRGFECPFTSITGLIGTGQSFSFAYDAVALSSTGDRVFAAVNPSQVAAYESAGPGAETLFSSRSTFAGLSTTAYIPGRRVIVVRSDGNTVRFRINGRDFVDRLPCSPAAFTGGVIGGAIGAGMCAQGNIREFRQWNRCISDAEILQFESECNVFTIRSGSPLPTSLPLVMVDGNSIVAGFSSGTVFKQWPIQLEAGLPTGLRSMAKGIVAIPTSSMITQAAQYVDVHYSASRTKNILLVQEGTNEIANHGRTAAQVRDNFITYCNARKAVGWTVILCDILPSTLFTVGNGQLAIWNAANALLDADFTVATASSLVWTPSAPTYADAYVQLSRATNMTDATNTTYYTDGTHPTLAGHTIMAATADPAVRLFL